MFQVFDPEGRASVELDPEGASAYNVKCFENGEFMKFQNYTGTARITPSAVLNTENLELIRMDENGKIIITGTYICRIDCTFAFL